MTKLPYDYTRCNGLTADKPALAECPIRTTCLRFTDRPADESPFWSMSAPTTTGNCPEFIEDTSTSLV